MYRQMNRPALVSRSVDMMCFFSSFILFFFNDTATTEIYTLSLHDALPIWRRDLAVQRHLRDAHVPRAVRPGLRSEEHTSELQSPVHLVCRLLLEKKKHASRLSRLICKNSSTSAFRFAMNSTASTTQQTISS